MKKFTKILFLIILLFCSFYYFITHDRNYNWSKEFEEEVYKSTINCNLKLLDKKECEAQTIKLPIKREVQIFLQKALNSIGLMNYNNEFGTQMNFEDSLKNENVLILGYCSGDHLLGIEIKCSNDSKQCLKDNFEKQFNNYKIIWTEK